MKIEKETPVIILCGGQGTRLREETEYKPKPMVEIGGKPVLWHIMKIYSYYGFNNFILALGYKGDLIRDYFLNYKYYNNDFTIHLGNNETTLYPQNGVYERNWKVTLVETGELAQTGARIKKCERFINTENFAVTYGDGVADVNVIDEYNFHCSHNKLVTMLGVKPVSKFGELVIDGDSVKSFSEKPQSKSVINGGFFIFKKEFFELLQNNDSCVLEFKPLEEATRMDQVKIHNLDGIWYCMDTYRDYLHLNNLWGRKIRPWAVWEKH